MTEGILADDEDEASLEHSTGGEGAFSRTLILGALAILCVLFALSLVRYRPPAAELEASAREFGAHRALATLRRLLPSAEPHPVGSLANTRVRERLVAEVQKLGLSPEVQSGVACGKQGICAQVHNVIVPLWPEKSGAAVVLAAHYDSVPAGPGISDDGAGVATLLEVARALRYQGEDVGPVTLLFTDGEEAGLIGSELFARSAKQAKNVKAVVNLEARGTSGPSLLFETSRGNADMIRAFAGSAGRPVTSSLFSYVYGQLRHDTDLSTFRKYGMKAVNFAFIESANLYHTPLDSIENLDPASLQHHGDNVLALVRGLSSIELTATPDDAVFVDVLAAWVLWWPKRAHLPIMLVLILPLLVGLVRLARADVSRAQWLRGTLATLLVPCAAALGAESVQSVLRPLGALPTPWPAVGVLIGVAVAAAALGTALLIYGLVGRGLPWRARLLSVWSVWLALALVIGALVPEVSIMFLPVAFVAGLTLLPAHAWLSGRDVAPRHRPMVALCLLLPLGCAATLWFSLLISVHAALGYLQAPVLAVIGACALLPALPLLAVKRKLPAPRLMVQPALALLAVLVVCVAGSWAMGGGITHTTYLYHEDHTLHLGRVFARASSRGVLPSKSKMRRADAGAAYPWLVDESDELRAWDARKIGVETPNVQVLESRGDGKKRFVKLRVKPDLGVSKLELRFPRDTIIASARVEGAAATAHAEENDRILAFAEPPTEGVTFELWLGDRAPVDALVAQYSYGLPSTVAPYIEPRPQHVLSRNQGDLTLQIGHVGF